MITTLPLVTNAPQLTIVPNVFCVCIKRFNPFLHKRMQDSSNVEISNPVYMRGECEDDATEPMEPAFTIDPDKVNFSLDDV